MNQRWGYLLSLVSLFCIFISCSSAGVGTVVNKPSPPTSNLFPDIDSYIDFSALIGGDGDEQSALVAGGRVTHLFDVAAFENIYRDGIFQERAEDVRDALVQSRDFGAVVANLMQEAGITELDDTVQELSLTESETLIEKSSAWEVEIFREPSDDNFSHFKFKSEDASVYGAYIVQTNASLESVKGALFYTRQDSASNVENEKRVVLLAFDFTDTSNALFVARVDQYLSSSGVKLAHQLHGQYNAESGVGIGEYLEINSVPPLRELFDDGVRFSWNKSTGLTCLVQAPDYTSGSLELRGSTYEFISSGADVPEESDVSEGVCTIDTPQWGSHIFSTDDLILRYEDTDPLGGTGAEYFNADFLLGDFDATTSIDTWLDASGF